MCTQEHVAERGEPAPCLGVLVPPADALAGATCLDADLPTCRRLRRRAADVHRLEVAQLARRVSESDARAARWEALARQPCPQAVTRVVERSRGAPAWVAWTALAVGLLGGGLLGWKARGLTR